MLFAIIGFVFTVAAAIAATTLSVAGLVNFGSRKSYDPPDAFEVSFWILVTAAALGLISLGIWQPMHWAGVA